MNNFKKNKDLILYLSKNDLKTKFAGSYLGVIWAFVQPVITIVLYWFVFQVGLKSPGVSNVPFVLWLMAGLIPWFFFQEAWMSATNCFGEYSYLVKKVVFNIDILPIVKILSSLWIHLFFIVVLLVIYGIVGFFPGAIAIQLLYYSICMIALVLALSYLTSAIAVFFKDTLQIVGIATQIGTWITPILWNIDTIELSPIIIKIFKLNPMYYIVQGYRTTLIYGQGFWEHRTLTLYFWVVTIIIFIIAWVVYRRLKPHFADSL